MASVRTWIDYDDVVMTALFCYCMVVRIKESK